MAGTRLEFDALVGGFLPRAPLRVARDGNDRPRGFMLTTEGRVEALFVDLACRGNEIGAALVRHALSLQLTIKTYVNE